MYLKLMKARKTMNKWLSLTIPVWGFVFFGFWGFVIALPLGLILFKLNSMTKEQAEQAGENASKKAEEKLNNFSDRMNQRTATMNAKRKMKKTGNTFEEQYKIELEKLK